MQKFCDTIVACDDASFDGTREYLQKVIPKDQLLLIPADKQDFRQELFWKQQMLDIVHKIRPEWVWWHDADEELDEKGVEEIRAFCESQRDSATLAYRFHYIQLWRQKEWHRIDDGFGDGKFIKLWRWQPYLSFNTRYGTHHDQFPEQLSSHLNKIEVAPGKSSIGATTASTYAGSVFSIGEALAASIVICALKADDSVRGQKSV
jgi:hypothetical protein